MLNLPLYFRVVEMHASDGNPHVLVLRECRRPTLTEAMPRPPTTELRPPLATISVEVSAEQFSSARVGMDLDLAISVLGQAIAAGPAPVAYDYMRMPVGR